jgi:hypothetical protein
LEKKETKNPKALERKGTRLIIFAGVSPEGLKQPFLSNAGQTGNFNALFFRRPICTKIFSNKIDI